MGFKRVQKKSFTKIFCAKMAAKKKYLRSFFEEKEKVVFFERFSLKKKH